MKTFPLTASYPQSTESINVRSRNYMDFRFMFLHPTHVWPMEKNTNPEVGRKNSKQATKNTQQVLNARRTRRKRNGRRQQNSRNKQKSNYAKVSEFYFGSFFTFFLAFFSFMCSVRLHLCVC